MAQLSGVSAVITGRCGAVAGSLMLPPRIGARDGSSGSLMLWPGGGGFVAIR
jgi:hypothetical protein